MLNNQKFELKIIFYVFIGFALYFYFMNVMGFVKLVFELPDIVKLNFSSYNWSLKRYAIEPVYKPCINFVKWTAICISIALICHIAILSLSLFIKNKILHIATFVVGCSFILFLVICLFLTNKYVFIDGRIDSNLYELITLYRSAILETLLPACALTLASALYTFSKKETLKAAN